MDHDLNWLPCRLVPIDGSSPRRAVSPAGGTAVGWSADGEWMHFTVELDEHGQLWRQRFPVGKPEQLTLGPAEAQGVAVDPAGRSLITSLGLRRNELWIRDARGERPLSTQGTVARWLSLSGPLGWSSVPSFSRDGRYLYYPLCGGCYAQWAPDGRRLYVTPTGSKQTLALPVEHGASAPQIPSGGVRSVDDHALVPGAVVLDIEFVSPRPDPSTYAYIKTSLQQNLYRVHLD